MVIYCASESQFRSYIDVRRGRGGGAGGGGGLGGGGAGGPQ